MRITWVIEGQFHPSSAYYQQIMLFSNYLHDFGVDSSIAAVPNFLEYGEQVLSQVNYYDPDVIITFGDVQPWDMGELLQVPVMSWFLWGSTHSIPVKTAEPLISFACVAQSILLQFEDNGLPASYVPHGFDPNVFRVGPKTVARQRLGWDHDKPVVLALGTNLPQPLTERGPDRKNWRGILESFADSIEQDAILYLHTSDDGFETLSAIAEELGISDSVQLADQKKVRTSGRDYDEEYVADLYRASDVLLFPSLAEGFGVPLIEAQACGIPVITSDVSPMNELVKTGTAVRCVPHPERSDWVLPSRVDLTKALEYWIGYVHNAPDEWAWQVANKVRGFSAENITEKFFIPALRKAAAMYPAGKSRTFDAREGLPLKLDIGSGGPLGERNDRTWTTVDKYEQANIQADMWDLPIEDESAEEIWSAHALEHIPFAKVAPTLEEWFRVLKPGGILTLLVPDFDWIAQKWLDEGAGARGYVLGNQTTPGEFHQMAWNLESLVSDLEKAGFEIKESRSVYTPEYSQNSLKVVATRA